MDVMIAGTSKIRSQEGELQRLRAELESTKQSLYSAEQTLIEERDERAKKDRSLLDRVRGSKRR